MDAAITNQPGSSAWPRLRGLSHPLFALLALFSVLPAISLAQYVERFQTWSATTADAWQVQSLSVAPFNVPANAVVEVAVLNSATGNERYGGVRAVGSSLERRLQLHEAEGGGTDVVVLHVQTNGSSSIEHYSDQTGQVTFILLGYWTSGTYVEAFSTFKAGSNTTWVDKKLCTYGVRPTWVVDIVMTNNDSNDEWEGGVRTNGSTLQRRLDLQEAESGGIDAAALSVKADSSLDAIIEVFAENNTSIDFYLVGFWSVAPGAYTELLADIGSPTSNNTWQDVDLTGSGVPNNAIADIALANDDEDDEWTMGVRANGSSMARLLELHEPEGGGADFGRMHVLTDGTAAIEFNHLTVSEPHTFHLMGYWSSCDTSIEYAVSDLGAITPSKSSTGQHINDSRKISGFEEDSSGNASAWYLDCGTFTALGALGGTYSGALGINDSNMIVGWAQIAGGRHRAFTWTSGGGMINLGTLSGRLDSEAVSVNASSEVVGTVVDLGSPPQNRLAFLYLPSPAYSLPAGMNSLGTLGGLQSVATSINNSGQVVGGAQDMAGNFRPFLWQNGTMTDLGTLGGESVRPDSRAQAINNNGDIAGWSYTAGGDLHAFLWDGSMTDLGVLAGGTQSTAFSISDNGVIVGTSRVNADDAHAFVWDATNDMRDLNDLIAPGSGWTLIRATDINTDGSIVGFGTNPSSQTRAFLLTPTCGSGGGGAVAASIILASGSGETDDDGAFAATATDDSGKPLASVEVVSTEAGVVVEFEVIEPAMETEPGMGVDSQVGFIEGDALGRTLKVITGIDRSQASLVTVSMRLATSDVELLEVDPDDMELHVLDSLSVDAGAWLPGGKNIGQSPPTTIKGDSGYMTASDGSVDYWAVRAEGGTFAVRQTIAVDPAPDRPNQTPPSRPCGLAMIQPLFACIVVLLMWNRRR